jgi:UDP-GlcNAc:undecaprenyl-phosphate GlcNAc-1-phosphate transferase
VALIIAFVVAFAVTPVCGFLATRLGVVDHPGPLKVHGRSVPYFGGVAVFVAFGCAVVTERASVLLPLGLALLIGAVDDMANLPAPWRLAGEVITGVLAAMVIPGRGVPGVIVTIVFVVVLCNAVNLLDGLDGLATGVCVASSLGFAFGFALDGIWSAVALALAGALLGFLPWNWTPARIYLGDAGSYLIGTALAVLLASAWGPGEPVAVGAGALLFVAVPVADTAVAIVRRARARRPLLAGDRGHIYDQLVDRGWPVWRVTVTCIAAQVLFSAAGAAITHLPAAAATAVAASTVLTIAWLALTFFTDPKAWAG